MQPDANAPNIMADLADATESRLSVGTVLRELFTAFGGPKGFAEQMKLDFDSCEPGHSNRIRIESDIMRALGNYDGDVDDLPADIEQLEAIARAEMAKQNQ